MVFLRIIKDEVMENKDAHLMASFPGQPGEMAEEIDLEKCTFRNFGCSVTLTLDRVEITLVRIRGRGLPTHQIRWKSEKLFVDVRTDVLTDVRTDGHT